MRLVALATLVVVCGAAKLDRTYLPPASSQTAGGLPTDLQTPLTRSSQNNQGLGGLPTGAYNNDFGGVVVDASAAGTRAAGPGESNLGNPRQSYGSQASKVGDAAFRQSQTSSFPNPGFNSQANSQAETIQGFEPQPGRPERQQAAQDRAANIVRYDSEVGPESFNYAFETDNGISAEENAVATNGVQAQGAFSYTSDDGQTYSVTYTADERGYQPKGDHLPTPPPIPEEILKSLEKNAQDEAAGLIDDGSYDASKYNEGSDYNESDNKGQYNRAQSGIGFGNGATSDISAGSSFVSQSTFAQQNADAGNNGDGNFEQSASNNAPGQFAQLSHRGSQQSAIGQSSGQLNIGNQKPAQNNFGYLPPSSQSGSQASFSGFRSQPLNKPSRNFQQNGFSNQRPSQSASASAKFGTGQVNEPQANGSPAHFNSASTQSQQGFRSHSQSQQPNFPNQNQNSNVQLNSQLSQIQSVRPTQQAFQQPQIKLNQFSQGFAPASQSASAFASMNAQPNQYSNNKPQAFQQNVQFNKFSANTQTQQNQFIQPQIGSNTPKPSFVSQNNQDNSYYYNQPAQPFRTPSFDGQRSPIQQPSQFGRVAQSYSANANAQLGSFPTQPSFPQRASTRYPQPPTLSPAEPTLSIQPEVNNHDHFNGVTQATASSFSANLNQQGPQTFTKPTQQRYSSQRPTQSSFSQTQAAESTPSQQYDGELYEYSKPADSLTTPKDSNSQGSEQVEAEVSPTQGTQAFATAEYQESSVATSFDQAPLVVEDYNQNSGSVASSFSNQGSSEAEFSQGSSSVAPGVNQVSSQYSQGTGSAPSLSQVSAASVAGKGEVFGGPRQAPSFDAETGYHY